MGQHTLGTEDHHQLTSFEGVHAAQCVGSSAHNPVPARYVWHHVLPQACGGQTVRENLVELCDNCHYTIHRLMWQLVFNKDNVSHHTAPQLSFALLGVNEAIKAGTQGKMPKEAAA